MIYNCLNCKLYLKLNKYKINECVAICSDENAHCINTVGKLYSCQYNPGFTGDGYSCSGVQANHLTIGNVPLHYRAGYSCVIGVLIHQSVILGGFYD